MKELEQKMEKMFYEYEKEHKKEPGHANCKVKYLDDDVDLDVTLSLSHAWKEEEPAYYYCLGLGDLKSLCEPGMEEFIITDIYEFTA